MKISESPLVVLLLTVGSAFLAGCQSKTSPEQQQTVPVAAHNDAQDPLKFPPRDGTQFVLLDQKEEGAFLGQVALQSPNEIRIFLDSYGGEGYVCRAQARVELQAAGGPPMEAERFACNYLFVNLPQPLAPPVELVLHFKIEDFGETSSTVRIDAITPTH